MQTSEIQKQPNAHQLSDDLSPAHPYQIMHALSQARILHIRDFAFSDDDERHVGVGSVIPPPPSATTAKIEATEMVPTETEKTVPATRALFSSSEPEPVLHIVLYDFQAEASNELSVNAGVPVRIERDLSDGWVLAHQVDHPERSGLIPHTYLQRIG